MSNKVIFNIGKNHWERLSDLFDQARGGDGANVTETFEYSHPSGTVRVELSGQPNAMQRGLIGGFAFSGSAYDVTYNSLQGIIPDQLNVLAVYSFIVEKATGQNPIVAMVQEAEEKIGETNFKPAF